MGELRDGLYYYKASAPPFSSTIPFAMHSQQNLDFSLWHQRLEHPSPSNMNKFIFIPNSCSYYNVCQQAKHTHLPFSLNHNKSTVIFSQIYCDIWGGYPTPSHTSAYYSFTIVDDYLCNTWVYLMRFKSETYSCLEHFCLLMKNQFSCPIRHI
jgi:hypothetical protein